MARKREYLSLSKATEGPRYHSKDKTPPNFQQLKNLYPSGDDLIPSLRSDFTYVTDQLEAFGDAWGGASGSVSRDDYLNAIAKLRSETTFYFSRLVPYTTTAGTATLKISTYATGTAAIATSTVTGVGTEWMRNAWAGCALLIGATWYLVTAVASDTSMTIDGTATVGAAAYTLYQGWYPGNADFPLSMQEWGNYTLVQAVNPYAPVNKTNISGPWINATNVFGDYDWTSFLDTKTLIGFDGTNFVSQRSTTLYNSTAPQTSWTSRQTSTGAITSLALCGTKWVAIGISNIWESADATGASWTDRKANDPGNPIVIGWDSTNSKFVSVAANGDVYHSTDLSGAWTTVAQATTLIPADYGGGTRPQLIWTGSKMIYAGGDGKVAGEIMTTATVTGSWVAETVTFASGVSDSWLSVASDATNHVMVGRYSGVYHSAGTEWASVSTGLTEPKVVYYTGSEFLLGDSVGQIATSTDGQTWTKIEQTDMTATLIWLVGVAGADPLYAWTSNTGYKGDIATVDEDAEPTDYSPLSLDYRSKCFATLDSWIMLGGVKEWDSDNSIWKYYPNRFRWPGPGTTNDWDGEGAGFLDKPGAGAILDMRGVGHNIVVSEESRLGVLQQLGDIDSPWGYQVLQEDITVISNLLQYQGDVVFVSDGGQLWRSNGSSVTSMGNFDLTEFDDFNSSNVKVWLDYFEKYDCMTVFYPQASGSTHKVYLVNDSGAVTHIELPEWTAADAATAMIPKSVFVSNVPGSEKLYVGYNPDTDNLDHTVTLYLNLGAAIKGTDDIKSGLDSHWHAIIETGDLDLVGEGQTTTLHELELQTHSSGGTVQPDVTAQVKSGNESAWRNGGDSTGTISLASTTATGTGTVFSNIIGINTGTVFTTPQPASRCRVFKHTVAGDTYAQLTLTTDYTITGTSQITLVSGLTSGVNLVVYWDSKPEVKVGVSDYLLGSTSDEMYRITSVTDYNTLVADHAPDATEAVTHLPAGQMDTGDSRRVIATPAKVEDANIKLRIIPRDSASASTRASITGVVIQHQPIDSQERNND